MQDLQELPSRTARGIGRNSVRRNSDCSASRTTRRRSHDFRHGICRRKFVEMNRRPAEFLTTLLSKALVTGRDKGYSLGPTPLGAFLHTKLSAIRSNHRSHVLPTDYCGWLKMQRLSLAWWSLAQYGGTPPRTRRKSSAAQNMPNVGAMK